MSLIDQVREQAAEEYARFLDASSAIQSVGERVVLYGQTDLAERNETYEVQSYLPGWFAIGDDGGGRALLMRLNRSPEVFVCGQGALGSVEPESVAESFGDWHKAACRLPDDEDFDDDFDEDFDDEFDDEYDDEQMQPESPLE